MRFEIVVRNIAQETIHRREFLYIPRGGLLYRRSRYRKAHRRQTQNRDTLRCRNFQVLRGSRASDAYSTRHQALLPLKELISQPFEALQVISQMLPENLHVVRRDIVCSDAARPRLRSYFEPHARIHVPLFFGRMNIIHIFRGRGACRGYIAYRGAPSTPSLSV